MAQIELSEARSEFNKSSKTAFWSLKSVVTTPVVLANSIDSTGEFC